MHISHLDHLVLTVRDIERTVTFYESVLGLTRETFGEGRVALRFGSQKINLHESGREFEPKASTPQPGGADFCLITTTTLAVAMAEVERHGIDIIAGPVDKIGAAGPLRSFYFRDPDGNLIEVATILAQPATGEKA